MKTRKIYLFSLLALLLPLAFTACDSANPELSIKFDTNYSEIIEALRDSKQSLGGKMALIEAAMRNGLNDNQSLLALIQDAIESMDGSMEEKLAAIEAVIKARTTSLETKLALAEAAVNEGFADSEARQKLMQEALASLSGTLDEKLAAIEDVMKSQNTQLETKLGLIEAAVQSGFADHAKAQALIAEAFSAMDGTLEEKMAAVEAAVASQAPELSEKMALIEAAVKEGFASDSTGQTLIETAIRSLSGTAEQKLAAIQNAMKSNTTDLETKLATIEGAIKTNTATVDQALDLVKQAVENLNGSVADKLNTLTTAISSQSSGLVTKFASIVSALEGGFLTCTGAIDLLQTAINTSIGGVGGDIQQLKTDAVSQLSDIATKLTTTELASALTDVVTAINTQTQTDAETLAAIQKTIEGIIEDMKPMTFTLTVSSPSFGFKTAWAAGDSIFVFFSSAAAPKYLKMGYNGTAWEYKEKKGAKDSVGSLGLGNGVKGTMTAVYLPFGSDCSVSSNGTSFVFSDTETPWYLTATLPYTVEDKTITGTLDLKVPDGYVQFFSEVASNYSITVGELREPNLTPQGIASIAADGSIVHTTIAHGAPLKGHLIYGTKKGFVFGGILATDVRNVDTSYHFTLVTGGWKGDYYYRSNTTTLYRPGNSGRDLDLDPFTNWTHITDYKPIDLGCDVQGSNYEWYRVYWASRDLGAASEDRSGGEATYGNYYAWGEISPKTAFSWNNYQWSKPDSTGCTKYNSSDDMSLLLPEDDAAYNVLGGIWRIPKNGEWARLGEGVNFEWIWYDEDTNGCAGFKVTSKKAGYDGQDGPSLFFPAAGYYGTAWNGPVLEYGLIGKGSSSCYWSSHSTGDSKAFYMKNCGSGYDSYSRFFGLPIRPVTY